MSANFNFVYFHDLLNRFIFNFNFKNIIFLFFVWKKKKKIEETWKFHYHAVNKCNLFLGLYVLNVITTSGKTEELFDELQRIYDIQPFIFMCNLILLKVSERKQESEDENLNKSINSLIGKTLSEFKTLKIPEVSQYFSSLSLGRGGLMILIASQSKVSVCSEIEWNFS